MLSFCSSELLESFDASGALLADACSQRLGHEFAIEHFLCVPPDSGLHGVASTLRRIPRAITVETDIDGSLAVSASQPAGISRERLMLASLSYREQIKRCNLQHSAQRLQG